MQVSDKVKQEAVQFLKRNKTMVVATASEDGEPECATVFYTTDDDLNFYFLTSTESQKVKNLKNNKRIAFTIGTGPKIITVQGKGVVEAVIKGEKQFMLRLGRKFGLEISKLWPVAFLPHAGRVLIKIKPTWLRFLNLEEKELRKGYHIIMD